MDPPICSLSLQKPTHPDAPAPAKQAPLITCSHVHPSAYSLLPLLPSI